MLILCKPSGLAAYYYERTSVYQIGGEYCMAWHWERDNWRGDQATAFRLEWWGIVGWVFGKKRITQNQSLVKRIRNTHTFIGMLCAEPSGWGVYANVASSEIVPYWKMAWLSSHRGAANWCTTSACYCPKNYYSIFFSGCHFIGMFCVCELAKTGTKFGGIIYNLHPFPRVCCTVGFSSEDMLFTRKLNCIVRIV